MRILCTSDVHIGRRSSGLPAHVDTRPLSAAEAWLGLVDYAVRERVDLLALSGDVVEWENRFFEAFGPLERGLERLAVAGIPTVAVMGNHDVGVLSRLAEQMAGARFHLLGRGGRWERWTLERDGEPILHVDGWSFPEVHFRDDPLASYSPPRADGVPVLGLLHADVDRPGSVYAPVRLADLRARPVTAWLLGHVHAPALFRADGSPPVLYPGSLQALDPGEPGPHGPWLLELEPGGQVSFRQIPLSRVRYEILEIPLDGVADPAELEARVTESVRSHLETIAPEAGPLEHLSYRIRLTGRTAVHRQVESRLLSLRDLELSRGEINAYVERADAETQPPVELETLVRGGDPVALLARLLLALRTGDPSGAGPEAARALEQAHARLAGVYGARPYLELDDATGVAAVDDDVLIRHLERQGWRLLDALLAQKEAS